MGSTGVWLMEFLEDLLHPSKTTCNPWRGSIIIIDKLFASVRLGTASQTKNPCRNRALCFRRYDWCRQARFVKGRIFLFIFGGEDSIMQPAEKALQNIWQAMVVRKVSQLLGCFELVSTCYLQQCLSARRAMAHGIPQNAPPAELCIHKAQHTFFSYKGLRIAEEQNRKRKDCGISNDRYCKCKCI